MIDTKRSVGIERLLRPDGKRGAVINRSQYERLRLFILTVLDGEEEKTLNDLLERAKTDIRSHQMEGDQSWLILQVKLDLEARGMIKSFVPEYNKRTNFLRVTRLGQKLMRQEKIVAQITTRVNQDPSIFPETFAA